MDRRNQRFRVLDRERIDPRPIVSSESRAAKISCGVVLFRMVPESEIKRSSNDTDGVVVCLFAPAREGVVDGRVTKED